MKAPKKRNQHIYKLTQDLKAVTTLLQFMKRGFYYIKKGDGMEPYSFVVNLKEYKQSLRGTWKKGEIVS